ncbi:PH domain-containing protein [Allofournierella sp.]|uniref:PH domain-containing protein n=1 Tax=Allofournierella sp. TaxID=1940256 RepID=UPI003AB7EB0C
MAKLKNGGFAVSVEEEELLWQDRKRILGLPISFTRYRLTAAKLLINVGLLNLREEEIRLYRVRDLRLTQTLADRLFGVGTICVESADASMPHVHLKHVKNPRKVKEVLSAGVEESRRRNGIRATEIVSGPMGHEDGEAPTGDGGLFPDADQNGVDDRLE